jgi:hypothetical protein
VAPRPAPTACARGMAFAVERENGGSSKESI